MAATTRLLRFGGLDRLAIAVSGLCVVHCLSTAVLLGLASAAGGLLASPLIHEVGLIVAILFGAIALGRGIVTHGYMMPSAMGGLGLGVMAGAIAAHDHGGGEALWTIVGVGLLAFGHDLNRRADA
jgi:hypothetical protein